MQFLKDGVQTVVTLLFDCVVGKIFCCFYVFSVPAGVYVGNLNLIASIPDPSILTFYRSSLYDGSLVLIAPILDHCLLFYIFYRKICRYLSPRL